MSKVEVLVHEIDAGDRYESKLRWSKLPGRPQSRLAEAFIWPRTCPWIQWYCMDTRLIGARS